MAKKMKSPAAEAPSPHTAVDPALMDLVAGYKRRVAGLYRPLPPSDLATVTPGPLLVSRKRDGELWFLVGRRDSPLLINSRGRTLVGAWPLLKAAAGLPDGVVLAGELHSDPADRRERVGDVAVALAAGPAAATPLHFTAFDLVRDADGTTPDRYELRLSRLEELLGRAASPLAVVPTDRLSDIDALRAHYQAVVADGGAEGLIARSASGVVYKIKPIIDLDCVVVGFTERMAEPGHVRSLLLGLRDSEGRVQLLGGCGNVGTQAMRRDLYARLAPLACPSTIRQASDGGGLYTFVRPHVVVTVHVTDLQAESSDGTLIRSPRLTHDGAGWTGQGLAPCPRPIHAVLDRVRDDKNADGDDTRFSQVEPWTGPGLDSRVTSGIRPASEVLRRQVWTKTTKGQVAVRKLLVWQTRKASIDPTFPAYVVHWTDYSPGRASPLEREVRLAPSEDDAQRLADALVAENIKKGWEPASA